MEQELVHLKTTVAFQEGRVKSKSHEVIEAFKNACLNLDAGLFEPFMEEEGCFEDLDKYRFLASLKSTFEEMMCRTSEELDVIGENELCQGCSYGKSVLVFNCYSNYGNRLVGTFGYLIDVRDGVLYDIYKCNGIGLSRSGLNSEIVSSILEKYRKNSQSELPE